MLTTQMAFSSKQVPCPPVSSIASARADHAGKWFSTFILGIQKAPLPVPEDQSTGEPQVEVQSKDRGKAVEELGGSGYPESSRSHLDTWAVRSFLDGCSFVPGQWAAQQGHHSPSQKPLKLFSGPTLQGDGIGKAVVMSPLLPRLVV